MAKTVLVEYTNKKDLKRKSRDLSIVMTGKSQKFSKGHSQKFSKGHSAGVCPDYRHAVDAMVQSEGFGSSGRVDSEDSCSPKRKCISLNVDTWDGFNIPLQIISLSKLSVSERKELEVKFRAELERVQALQKDILSRSVTNTKSNVHSLNSDAHVKKRDVGGSNGSNLKRGLTGRFESAKRPHPSAAPISSSFAMLMKQCEALLKRVMSHQFSWVFNTPVDIVKLKIPDYYTVIKHPMDLGSVKSKLVSGAYSSPWEFAADVRLTFTNAMTYNPPGNDVHIMADSLSKFFETRWKPIEKKLVAADVSFRREAVEEPKVAAQPMKSKTPPQTQSEDIVLPVIAKAKMTDEEKHTLGRCLESLPDMPDHIIDFLRRHGDNANPTSDDEIEIDIDSLNDDTLFELRRILDDYLREKQAKQLPKTETCDMEILNESGLSNSSMHPCKGNEPNDEDVDIGGNDPPISSYPSVEIDKDKAIRTSRCSSSSSDSESSSDSDTGSSSGSESDVQATSPPKVAKANVGPTSNVDQEESDVVNPLDINRSVGGLDQVEQDIHPHESVEVNGRNEGENAPSERQVSPEKLYRAALLRSRFADTIVKAREKTLDQGEKGDPEKLRREREELERQQREEKARLQAEAKAAEDARLQAEAEAAAEAKRKRELEREAARQSLLKMEKTVDINENSLILKDLEMLRSVPGEPAPSSVDETSPCHSPDGIGGFKLGGSNPLEQLGLYMKVDDEEEEEGETNELPIQDVEEGEID